MKKSFSPIERLKSLWKKDPESFLGKSRGVIHVGANSGQERELYAAFDLPVLWIEPIPEVFEKLLSNIAMYPKQRALRALVTDSDGREVPFYISNNEGQSSSVLDLAEHTQLWPDVIFSDTMILTTVTLPTLLAREGIDPAIYDVLVLDTQGSELLILRGAAGVLRNFHFIKTEAADFEAYAGGCKVEDLNAFLSPRGFRPRHTECFAQKEGVGSYYNVLYERERR